MENFRNINTIYQIRRLVNVINLVYKKTLKQSVIDKQIHGKEEQELRKITNRCFYYRTDRMKKIQFKVEDTFVDILNKEKFTSGQIFDINIFFQPN